MCWEQSAVWTVATPRCRLTVTQDSGKQWHVMSKADPLPLDPLGAQMSLGALFPASCSLREAVHEMRSPLPWEPYAAPTGRVLDWVSQYIQIAVLVLPGVAVLCVLAGPDGPKSCCKACRKPKPWQGAHLAWLVHLVGRCMERRIALEQIGQGVVGRGMQGMAKPDGLLKRL